MCTDDISEAYNLIKDLEPTTPQEYILKGVVNAALGQEQGSVSSLVDEWVDGEMGVYAAPIMSTVEKAMDYMDQHGIVDLKWC